MTELAILGGKLVFDPSELGCYNPIGLEEVEAVNRVMKTGNLSGYIASWGDGFFGGPLVQSFEKAWSEEFKVKHSIAVNSNTSGLISAVGAVGVGPGDEVIVPPVSMSATAIAPLFYGGIPKFVDIEEDSFCLDPDLVRENITPRTKAIIAVNLFGQPAALHELRQIADENDIQLIEDNAQAPMATENGYFAGTIGHIGVFSLNFHKHIHTGEGGVCTTNDNDLALRLQMIRNHAEACVEDAGMNDLVNMVGFNMRMTEMCAAVGLEQLKKASRLIADRERLALRLNSGLSGLDGIVLPVPRKNCRHVYYMWQSRFLSDAVGVSRAVFSRALNAEGFPNFVGYLPPLYWLPIFQNKIAIGGNGYPFNLSDSVRYEKGICPVAEKFHLNESLGFDICGILASDEQVDKMIDAFLKVYENRGELKHVE